MGNDRFVIVSSFNDSIYVHMRQYEQNKTSGRSFPTKTGICFKPKRFANLLRNIDEVNETVEQMAQGQANIELKKHIGGGVYLTVTGGYPCINIRKYFVPEGRQEEIPTRMGIALRMSEWRAFVGFVEEIKNLSTELKDAEPCYLSLDHANLMGYLNCNECNPFGDKINY